MDKHIQHAGGEKAKTIVVSAVNLRKGGTLTILRDCLGYLSSLARGGGYRVVALVGDGSFMNGLSYAANRWAFGYSFLTALILVMLWPELFQLSRMEIHI